jgi:phosphopantothenoylcysteine decarboxylase/phosphopantothenate--cysteine ligase
VAGLSDDLLTATLLATRAPVVICPAMHTEMWEHPAVQDNLAVLRRRGVHIVEPEAGRLAGGDVGVGRLADPAAIIAAVESALTQPDLDGLRVLVTAGGTREPIDPVRFIGNRSSGKQGHAVADEAASRGAKVVLVTTTDRASASGVEVVRVDTAAEMADAVLGRSDAIDVIVMAAAVADFRPVAARDQKIKKSAGVPEVALEPTIDILGQLGRTKRDGQVIIGFAAETDNVLANAQQKLQAKHVDFVVANNVAEADAGFEHDTNRVSIIGADGTAVDVPLSDKRQIARAILDVVAQRKGSNQ